MNWGIKVTWISSNKLAGWHAAFNIEMIPDFVKCATATANRDLVTSYGFEGSLDRS